MMHHRTSPGAHAPRQHRIATTAAALFVWALTVPSAADAQQGTPAVEAQLAEQVVDREPQGVATAFGADVGQVYCWTRVSGAAGTSIQHVWIHDGVEYPVTLDVGGSPWRTWSSKNIPPEWAGDWRVEIRDASGNVLEGLSFTVGG